MSDAVIIAMIAALPGFIASLGTLIVSIITVFKLTGVHKQINSRMDQLLDVTGTSERAKGIKEERERITSVGKPNG